MSAKPIYVLDTHALVHFLKRDKPIGRKARIIMLDSQSDLVVPIFLFDEIYHKSIPLRNLHRSDKINLPPATVLRILSGSTNIKVFPRSPAVEHEELSLRRDKILNRKINTSLPDQDIPICATALAIKQAFDGRRSVFLISKDNGVRRWGRIPVIWD